MKKSFAKSFISILILSLYLTGCLKNEEYRPAPLISFETGGTFLSKDTTVYAGENLMIGLKCQWNGTDPLKTVAVYSNQRLIGSYAVPTIESQGFTDTLQLIKGENTTEEWVFQIVDSQGISSYIGLVLTLNTNGGQIDNFSTTIGAPQNTTLSSYYATSTNLSYSAANAKNNQSLIDFLCAYDVTNGNNLVSPNANNLPEPFKTELTSWTTKNATLFCSTTLSTDQFKYINLDKLLINSFSINPLDQKNKAKNLKVNDIYSFKLNDGRIGVFKVTSLTEGIDGKVGIEVKVQHK